MPAVHAAQEDLKYFEASEDQDEEFYAGGGQYRRHGLEHFPQLWCQNGSYSVYGQVRACVPTHQYHPLFLLLEMTLERTDGAEVLEWPVFWQFCFCLQQRRCVMQIWLFWAVQAGFVWR